MDNIYETQEKNKSKLLKEDILTEREFYLEDSEFYLKDSDFYPPADNRTLDVHRRIYKGRDFEEYANYIYDLYEEEGFYED